jgi:hypothetical protein
MEGLLLVFVHILCLVLVGALFYWLVTLLVGLLPAPIANPVRVILLILLILIAICFILGEVGLWGTWGYGYTYHPVHRL